MYAFGGAFEAADCENCEAMAGPFPAPPPDGGAGIEHQELTQKVMKIRKDFPESWIWTSLVAIEKK